MSFGNNIKNLRIKNNMTQKELADILNLSRPTIGRYESDERFPDKDVITAIAKIFNVSTDSLFGINTPEQNNKVMKPEINFTYSCFENLFLKNNIDIQYLEDENFIEDIFNFGIKAALKIKNIKDEKLSF